MICNIIPYGDKILVERVEAEKTTSGGIILPQEAQKKHMFAKVIAVGKGVRKDNGEYVSMDIKEGDIVFFTKYSGTEIEDSDGNQYFLLSERDIIAKRKC